MEASPWTRPCNQPTEMALGSSPCLPGLMVEYRGYSMKIIDAGHCHRLTENHSLGWDTGVIVVKPHKGGHWEVKAELDIANHSSSNFHALTNH